MVRCRLTYDDDPQLTGSATLTIDETRRRRRQFLIAAPLGLLAAGVIGAYAVPAMARFETLIAILAAAAFIGTLAQWLAAMWGRLTALIVVRIVAAALLAALLMGAMGLLLRHLGIDAETPRDHPRLR